MSNGPPLFVCLECNRQTRPLSLRRSTVADDYEAMLSCGCEVAGDVAEPMLAAEAVWERKQDAIHAEHLAACPCHACITKQVGL